MLPSGAAVSQCLPSQKGKQNNKCVSQCPPCVGLNLAQTKRACHWASTPTAGSCLNDGANPCRMHANNHNTLVFFVLFVFVISTTPLHWAKGSECCMHAAPWHKTHLLLRHSLHAGTTRQPQDRCEAISGAHPSPHHCMQHTVRQSFTPSFHCQYTGQKAGPAA